MEVSKVSIRLEIVTISSLSKAINGRNTGMVQTSLVAARLCTIPVFRPLIAFDKEDIVTLSQKIDTYETSIQPFEDCCTIFVAKHPVTKPNLNVIRRSEKNLEEKIDAMVAEAIETAELVVVG